MGAAKVDPDMVRGDQGPEEVCMCACGTQGKVLWSRGTNENPRAGHPPAGPSTGLSPSASARHTEEPVAVRGDTPGTLRRG